MAAFHYRDHLFKMILLPSALVVTLVICERRDHRLAAPVSSDEVRLTLSSRVLTPQVSREALAGSAGSIRHSENGDPRVDFLDEISPEALGVADEQDVKNSFSVPTQRKRLDLKNQPRGIRTRLLLEAAKRSLSSPLPWADLALVATSFQRLGHEEAARYWFQRASRLAFDPDDIGASSRAFRELVKSAFSAGFDDLAKELIARIPEGSEQSRAQAELVKAHARKKDFELAHQLAESLGDTRARGLALRGIAESEARFENLDSALRTLQMIHDPVERDRALSTVIAIRAAMGDTEGSTGLLRRFSDTRMRSAARTRIAEIQQRGGILSLGALIGLLGDPHFRDPILRDLIIKETSRAGNAVLRPKDHRITTIAEQAKAYESLVMLQLRYGDLKGALDHARDIQLEMNRYRAIQAVAVAEVKDHGVASARRTADLIGNVKLRQSTYGKIAQRAAIYGQSQGAVATIRSIRSPSQRALAYANVGLTQAHYGRDHSALLLVQDATREIAKVGKVKEKARAQGLVAQIFAETGDAHSALRAAAEIDNQTLRDSAYQQVALSFANVTEPALAAQSAQFIERDVTRERALNSVATTLAKKVSFTDAIKFAERIDGRSQQVRFLLGVAGRKS